MDYPTQDIESKGSPTTPHQGLDSLHAASDLGSLGEVRFKRELKARMRGLLERHVSPGLDVSSKPFSCRRYALKLSRMGTGGGIGLLEGQLPATPG